VLVVLAFVDRQARDVGLNRTKVRILPDMLIWLMCVGANSRGEVPNLRDCVLRSDHLLSQREQIKPSIRSAFECSVVEVETIYVDSCSQFSSPEKSQGSRRSLVPFHQKWKGEFSECCSLLARSSIR